MRRNLIEAWAIRVLENLKKNGQTEDHHVELKGEWIEAKKAARRIAGLANSAPDEYVLWIVGVDEETGDVRGAQEQEFAEWWPQVESEFADHVAPDMTLVGMTWGGQPVVAIAFATDRTPYVVRNPDFGNIKGHNIAWEVPMRVGTDTRTATRNQLLSVLSPALKLPRYELNAASAILHKPERKEYTERRIEGWAQKCIVNVNFYLIAQGDEAITLDPGESEVVVDIPGFAVSATIGVPALLPMGAPNVSVAGSVCRFTDTARFLLKAEGDIPSIGNQYTEKLRVEVKIRPIGYERMVVVSGTLALQEGVGTATGITHSFVLNKKTVENGVPIVAPGGMTRKNPWP